MYAVRHLHHSIQHANDRKRNTAACTAFAEDKDKKNWLVVFFRCGHIHDLFGWDGQLFEERKDPASIRTLERAIYTALIIIHLYVRGE